MKTVILSVLCILLTEVLFVPVGLYLQWALPGDGPYKLVFSLYSVPILIVALVLLWTVRKTRDDTTRQAGAVAATCLLLFFVLAKSSYGFHSLVDVLGRGSSFEVSSFKNRARPRMLGLSWAFLRIGILPGRR